MGKHIPDTTDWSVFAGMMNERATELGCLNSHFVNPNGLPDEDHYTTAYDLAMIGRAFFSNEKAGGLGQDDVIILIQGQNGLGVPENIVAAVEQSRVVNVILCLLLTCFILPKRKYRRKRIPLLSLSIS